MGSGAGTYRLVDLFSTSSKPKTGRDLAGATAVVLDVLALVLGELGCGTHCAHQAGSRCADIVIEVIEDRGQSAARVGLVDNGGPLQHGLWKNIC